MTLDPLSSAPLGEFEQCYCTGVTRAQVLAACARGMTTVEQLRRGLGVCGGCGTCRPEVERLLEQARTSGHLKR